MNLWKLFFKIFFLVKIVVNGQYFKTEFEISLNRYEVSTLNLLNSQLNIFKTKNLIYCSKECSKQIQCSLFDFDSLTNVCRLFIFGSIKSSLSSISRVGFVKYSIEKYLKYNQTCQTNFNEINRYLICETNNKYQCPQKLYWNGTMCSGLYWAIGPQLNLNSSILRGWTLCYNDTYSIQLNGQPLNNILSSCNRSKLLLACGRLNNSKIYSVAAMDYRENVLYNCSYNISCSYKSNGVQWYFSSNYSWGFADQSDSLTRSWCDGDQYQNPTSRLCWHTISGFDGYRCGSTIFNLSISPLEWQRVIWHTD